LGAKPFNYMGLKALFCLLTHPAPASRRRPSLLKERGKAPKVRRGESKKLDNAYIFYFICIRYARHLIIFTKKDYPESTC
ncbi:MAG: hypothetical protein WC384_01430, partial [Prolixibacteraceae bacterium]